MYETCMKIHVRIKESVVNCESFMFGSNSVDNLKSHE